MQSDLVKGALDKYNIYLYIFNSIADFKLNQYRKFADFDHAFSL